MTKTYRVYCYTNTITGMKYVGCTHLYQTTRAGKNGKQYVKCCSKFGSAITEYGWNNFVYSVIEDGLTKEQAEDREKYWISELGTVWPDGYNLDGGGRNGHKAHIITRKIQSECRIGEKCPIYGKHWFNNGEKELFAYECPEGYIPGRLKKTAV